MVFSAHAVLQGWRKLVINRGGGGGGGAIRPSEVRPALGAQPLAGGSEG